jgi:hypothetical protein
MDTITVRISEEDRAEYGIEEQELDFEQLKAILDRGKATAFLKKAAKYAEQVDLSSMTPQEIQEEIAQYRRGRTQ